MIAVFLDSNTRQQGAVVYGRVSSLTPVISGVPQGTVLGPVLFLIHIRNIAEGLSEKTSASSFADDTRVQRGIHSSVDCSALQADLRVIYNWASRVNMHFNGDKFECLRLWPKNSSAPDYDYLGPDGEPIEVKDSLKDLGVYLGSDLTFTVHVEKTVAAASKLAGWGLRTFKRRSLGTMKTIWKTLVQPKLDYCSQFWSPGDQDAINRIESVQRHFLSKVSSMEGLNHWDRLSMCKMYSQERRRDRYMILFLWKVSQGMVNGYTLQFTSTKGRRGRTALPHNIVSTSPSSVKKARECSLGVKGAKMFNLIPVEIRNIDSNNVEAFKAALDTFLERVPDHWSGQ